MSTEIERKRAELERELRILQQKEDAEKERLESLKLCIGKYFKLEQTWHRTTAKSTSYIHVLGLSEPQKDYWKGHLDVDRIEIQIDKSRWQIVDGEIVFQNARSKMSAAVRNRSYDLGRAMNGVNKIKPEWVRCDEKSGKVTIAYTSSTWYQECSKEEFESVVNATNKACEAFNSTFEKELNNSTPPAQQFTVVELKAISDLVAKLDSGITLGQLTRVAKKVAKYNYFDKSNQLPELIQYELNGDKGLNLDIRGGDDGTDYEPYTTHYYISKIDINWATILYPIRTLINGKVMDLVSKLEDLKKVYYTSSWECQFDTSGYDASFEKAYLKPRILEQVNSLIKEHLK